MKDSTPLADDLQEDADGIIIVSPESTAKDWATVNGPMVARRTNSSAKSALGGVAATRAPQKSFPRLAWLPLRLSTVGPYPLLRRVNPYGCTTSKS